MTRIFILTTTLFLSMVNAGYTFPWSNKETKTSKDVGAVVSIKEEIEQKENNFADNILEEDVEVALQKSAFMQVDENYNEWRKKVTNHIIRDCKVKNIDLSLSECSFDTNVAYGDAIVKVNSDNFKWVNARSMAYTEALIDAYTKTALEQSTTNQNIILKELIDDQTPLNPDELKTTSKLEALWNKAVAFAGGKLDSKLEELGINPEQYNVANNEKKKTILKSAITQKSITKALADTSGMIPLQTFEGTDGKGNYAVRVAISKSPKRIALVKSILRNGSDVPANPTKKSSKTIEEQIIVPNDILFNQFGTRLLYDKEGFPVLIAFGQAGVVNSGSEAMKSIKLESARNLAKTNARDALTNLLKSSTVFKSVVQQVSSAATDMKLIDGNEGITEEMIENVDYINSIDNTSKTTSQITNFEGIRELHNWNYVHPKLGHEVVGTILMWSPKTASHTKGIINEKSNQINQNYVPDNAGSQRGIETDDYDF